LGQTRYEERSNNGMNRIVSLSGHSWLYRALGSKVGDVVSQYDLFVERKASDGPKREVTNNEH